MFEFTKETVKHSPEPLRELHPIIVKMSELVEKVTSTTLLDQSIIKDEKDKETFNKLINAMKPMIDSQEEKLSIISGNINKLTPVLEKTINSSIHNLNEINNLCNEIYGRYWW